MRSLILALGLLAWTTAIQVSAQTPSTWGAPFVSVDNSSQLFSNQIFDAQPAPLLDQVDAALKRLDGRLVRLNVVAVDLPTIESLASAVQQRYAHALPVISAVVGKLSRAEAKLGIDVVIAFKGSPKEGVRVEEDPFGRIQHPSSTVYISGQAEPPGNSATATLGTIVSLRDSLKSLDLTLDDVVQIRAFLNPIRTEKRARADIESVLEKRQVPIVFVEWKSTNLPVEIELVASSAVRNAKPVEYLSLLGLTNSTIYSRAARVNNSQLIYIGGQYASSPGELKPEAEVMGAFTALQAILDQTGSDMEHLAKATYLCSSDGTSEQINALRPIFFNPQRPPAASKAMVPGVGMANRFFMMDMIATPK